MFSGKNMTQKYTGKPMSIVNLPPNDVIIEVFWTETNDSFRIARKNGGGIF
jgi:hypothetical protein